MLRAKAFHILSLTLACLGAAAWARAVDLGVDGLRWCGVALWLMSAACAALEARAGRRARAAVVRQLRQAAAAVRPDDARFDAASVDADSLGAAVDGLIAAGRVQRMTLEARVRELEITVRAVSLERDRATAVVAEMAGAVRDVGQTHDRPRPREAGEGGDAHPRPRDGRRFGAVRRRYRAALARDVARLRRDFVSLVSHKFRTPLASIRAYTEMLIDGEAVDARSQREFLDVIHAEADRLGQSIDNVLSLARLDAGLAAGDLRLTPLGEVVDAALREVRPRAQTKNIDLQVDLAAGADGADGVLADRQLLGQVVANLLENAVKFTPAGGRVTVRTSVDAAAGKVGLRVDDTGVGIDPKALLHLFDSENGGGPVLPQGTPVSGLGLAVARRVVESVHGGRLTADSRPGQGSSFAFEMDRHAVAASDRKTTDGTNRDAATREAV